MGMMSEIAIENAIRFITEGILRLHDAEDNITMRRAYRKAVLEALRHFDYETPPWARKLQLKMEEIEE